MQQPVPVKPFQLILHAQEGHQELAGVWRGAACAWCVFTQNPSVEKQVFGWWGQDCSSFWSVPAYRRQIPMEGLLAFQKLTFSSASLVTHLCHKVPHVAKSIQCISYYMFLLPRYYER